MEKQKFPKILISGCGMSFGGGERPTWINVLKICGLNITDLTGPGISNNSITNNFIIIILSTIYIFFKSIIIILGLLKRGIIKKEILSKKNNLGFDLIIKIKNI